MTAPSDLTDLLAKHGPAPLTDKPVTEWLYCHNCGSSHLQTLQADGMWRCPNCHALRAPVEIHPTPELVATLERIKAQPAPYPADLLAARRIAFTRQIEQYNAGSDGLWKSDPDAVEGESHVSDWEDERNSRPFPY